MSSTSSVFPSARASSSALRHEQLRDTAPARRAMDEELRDLRPVRLVRRQREDHLHRPDEVAVGERREDQPAALLDLGGEAFERGSCVLVSRTARDS